jgi:hypothetical protein
MSSSSGPVAAHNLVFGDGMVSLVCASTGTVVAQRAPGDDPARIGEALHALAARCDGPVAAVLPQAVFRAMMVRRGRVGRLAARLALAWGAGLAPAALAGSLGFGPRALALATVPAERRSRVAAVAVERRKLGEAARYLGAHGIAVAAVRPDPELLPGRVLPNFVLTAPPAAHPAARPAVLRAQALLPAVRAWLAERRARHAWPRSLRRTLAGGAAAAAVLIAVLALAGREAPAPDVPVAGLPALPEMAGSAEVADAPAPEVTVDLRQPRAPRARALPGLALLTHEAPRRRPEALVALPAALGGPAFAAVASRSVPPDIAEDAKRAAAAAQARAEATRLAALSPVPRPEPEAPGTQPEASGAEPEVQQAGGPMPRPRPDRPPEPAAAAEASAAPAPAGLRPQPRPLSEAEEVARAVAAALAAAPVQTAALDPAALDPVGAPAAASAGPRPAPRQAAAVPAAPRAAVRAQAPAAQPAPARPAPAVAVRPAPQAAPRQMAALPPQAPPAAAAPPRAAPDQPQRQAARPPQAQPQPQAQRQPQLPPQPQRQVAPAASGGSGNISLIGVFGASNQRHALVRLPNGSVQRVRPGETVAGAQVAAVGADNVRIRVNGSDRVLRLPD